MNDINELRVLVVGGGAAGWLSANIIAAKSNGQLRDGRQVKVTLIESPLIPIIGVGEGSWPSLRSTLSTIGISEIDFLLECDASFKQASKFCGWKTGRHDDFYFHPFTEPKGASGDVIYKEWLNHANKISFASAMTSQADFCMKNLAPKPIGAPQFSGVGNYGYHFDARKFSNLLCEHGVNNLQISHILDEVIAVNLSSEGAIESISTQKSGLISADIFIDCTGANSLLLGESMKVPFVECRNLLNDAAVALQVPYGAGSIISSNTIATAQESGWVWDIGLFSRRGIGYVYSSAHISADNAECVLREYARNSNANPDEAIAKHISIRAGRRKKVWEKNCVAIGMSAGFIEPLEASALAMIELSANLIADELPVDRHTLAIAAKRFNKKFEYRWDKIEAFLKLHYILSERRDSSYWRDATSLDLASDELLEFLDLWRFRTPSGNDFDQSLEVFPSASYQYVLYGMGFISAVASCKSNPIALSIINENLEQADRYSKILPTNNEYLSQLRSMQLDD